MVFQDKYVQQDKLCETNDSIVYKSLAIATKTVVCVKMERNPSSSEYLINETKVRKFLGSISGIPPIIDYGFCKGRRFIVYPFKDRTLYRQRLNEPQMLQCGSQLIKILQQIHHLGILHCDISACNILTDSDLEHFFINDFGQSRHFTYALDSGQNMMLGCPLFCSPYVHQKKEYSFRDDLISLGYVLYYCIDGKTPWSGLKTNREILEQKERFKAKYWTLNLPEELKIFFNYCFHLGINDKPEYKMLHRLFERKENELTLPT